MGPKCLLIDEGKEAPEAPPGAAVRKCDYAGDPEQLRRAPSSAIN